MHTARYRRLRDRTCAGFSLIELLVVIGVITLLVALLLPTIRSARERAVRVECLSNLRQVYAAASAYQVLHGELPPSPRIGYIDASGPNLENTIFANNSVYPGRPRIDLVQLFRDTLKDFRAWRCPAIIDAPPIDDPRNLKWPTAGANSSVYGTYAYYPHSPARRDDSTPNPSNVRTDFARNTRIKRPETVMLITDRSDLRRLGAELYLRVNHMGSAYAPRTLNTVEDPAKNPSNMGLLIPYSGQVPPRAGMNIVFYDGHGEWLYLRQAEVAYRWSAGENYTFGRWPKP